MSFDKSTTAFSLLEASTQVKTVDEILYLNNNGTYTLNHVVEIFKNIDICEMAKNPLLLPTLRKITETFKRAIDEGILEPLEVPLKYETIKGKTINAVEILLLTASKFNIFEPYISEINQILDVFSSHFETKPSFTFMAKIEQNSHKSFTDKITSERGGKSISIAPSQ
jgi:hypothetical protein